MSFLSVQSHVVHGYVGNKAATFPLQLRGWDVDALNTVQFSNHPAYGSFAGTSYPAEELMAIYDKIAHNSGKQHTVLLTGYITSATTLRTVQQIYKKCKILNDNVKWFFDPVLGDNDRLYVSEQMVPEVKHVLLSGSVFLATPNKFEFETLISEKLHDLRDIKNLVAKFHKLYPQVPQLVITSIEAAGKLYCVGVCFPEAAMVTFSVDKIESKFYGSGDLFSAILADCYVQNRTGETSGVAVLADALAETLTCVEQVLQKSKNRLDLDIVGCKSVFLEHNTRYKGQVEPLDL